MIQSQMQNMKIIVSDHWQYYWLMFDIWDNDGDVQK